MRRGSTLGVGQLKTASLPLESAPYTFPLTKLLASKSPSPTPSDGLVCCRSLHPKKTQKSPIPPQPRLQVIAQHAAALCVLPSISFFLRRVSWPLLVAVVGLRRAAHARKTTRRYMMLFAPSR